MLRRERPVYIAIIYAKDGSVAGTGFSIREGLLITCAHVVRDALGLGAQTPQQEPDEPVRMRFPYCQDKPELLASVVAGGWFRGNGFDLNLSDLKDIAILAPADEKIRFPVGPPLVPLRWSGSATCFGFPAIRKGGHRAIKGEVDPIEETDGWLNFRPSRSTRRPCSAG